MEDTIVTSSTEEYQVVGTSTDGGVLAGLGIDGSMFIFQLVNLTLVMLTVWFLILKPLTKKMEERRVLIDESLDQAKIIETNLATSKVRFEESIAEAQKKSNEIIAQAHHEARMLGEQMRGKTEEEVAELVAQAKKYIEKEKEEMQKKLRKETVEIVVDAMEKIFEEKMDDQKNKKFVEDILKNSTKL
jgi:F-type H+-transporting ATPase subunit b